MPVRCVITGMGSRLGSLAVTVGEVERRLGIDKGRIERLGIRRLHYFGDGETLLSVSKQVAMEAIEKANLCVGDIHGIYGLTAGPSADYLMPGYTRVLGDRLGLSGIPMQSISMGCAGGVHALEAARNRLVVDAESGRKRNYLVVTGDNMENGVNSRDPRTKALFSSGAAALVVTNEEKPGYAVEKAESRALPSDGRLYCMSVKNTLAGGEPDRFVMDGDMVYDFGVRDVLPAAMELMGWGSPPGDCYIVPHQANGRMLKMMAHLNNIKSEQMYADGIEEGNAVAASIFMGLKDATERGLNRKYPHTLLLGFGAELQVAVAYLERDF